MRLALTILFVLCLWSVASAQKRQNNRRQGDRNNHRQGDRNNQGGRGHNNQGGRGQNNQGGRGHNNQGGRGHNDEGGQGNSNNNRGNRGHNNRGGRPQGPVQDLYSLSQSIGGACSPRDSCKELSRLRGTRTWNDRLCDCGPECIRFSTCCADSMFAGKFPAEPRKNEECLQPQFFRTYYTMVSKCDDGFKWREDVKRKCEDKGYFEDGEPLVRNLPLTSIGTLTTYRNFYCAVCNYGGDDLLGWEVEVKKMPQNMEVKRHLRSNAKEYNEKHIVWDQSQKSFVIRDKAGQGHSFTFMFRIPAYLRSRTRNCHPELRQTCKDEHKEMQELCHAYYSPIKLNSKDKDRTYRNMHCAKCRGVDPRALEVRQCRESRKGGGSDDDDEESRAGKQHTIIDFNHYGDSAKKHKYLQISDCGRDGPMPDGCRQALCVAAKGKPCN